MQSIQQGGSKVKKQAPEVKRRSKLEKNVDGAGDESEETKEMVSSDELLRPSPEVKTPQGSHIPSFVWAIAAYLAFSYVFSSQ